MTYLDELLCVPHRRTECWFVWEPFITGLIVSLEKHLSITTTWNRWHTLTSSSVYHIGGQNVGLSERHLSQAWSYHLKSTPPSFVPCRDGYNLSITTTWNRWHTLTTSSVYHIGGQNVGLSERHLSQAWSYHLKSTPPSFDTVSRWV